MTHASFTHHVLPILENASPDRLEKAVSGLLSGAYHITVTRQTETELSAFVRNGDGAQYGTTLTEHGPFCSCPDSMYRHVTCKHAAALAPHTIRTPKAPVEEGQPREERKSNLKLVRTRPAWVASA